MSSLTRDCTRTPCAGRASLSHRSPGKPLCFFLFHSLFAVVTCIGLGLLAHPSLVVIFLGLESQEWNF